MFSAISTSFLLLSVLFICTIWLYIMAAILIRGLCVVFYVICLLVAPTEQHDMFPQGPFSKPRFIIYLTG